VSPRGFRHFRDGRGVNDGGRRVRGYSVVKGRTVGNIIIQLELKSRFILIQSELF
jgi:hypothetical protein